MTIEGPRAATRDELPLVVDLADRVFRSSDETSMGRDFPLLFHEDNLHDLRIFADDGVPVAHVGMFRRDVCLLGTRHKSCAIGAVCTDAAYRGHGLGTRLVEDARRICLRDGVDLMLISGRRGLYRRLGYVTVGDHYYATARQDTLPGPAGYSLRPWAPEDLPALVRLHSAEPVRFVREPREFQGLLEAERIHNGEARTRVVVGEDDDRPVAYVTYKVPGTRGVPEDAVEVDEMSGSRTAIVHAVRDLFTEYGIEKVILNCLGGDGEMRTWAQRLGWPCESHGFRGTVGILDAERFWQACGPLFRERLGEERFARLSLEGGETSTIRCGDESLTLDMSGLTNLVFLPESRRGELELPLSPDGELAGLLSALFPMPFLEYGLNYV